MTPDELRICNVVDTLIKKNRSFALWRIPGESPRFAMQTSGSARLLYHIEELDEQSGFVIAPFHVSKQHPIVLIRPDIQELPSDEEIKVSCLWNKSSMPTEQEFHHSETLVSYALPRPKKRGGSYHPPFQYLHRTAASKAVRETRAVTQPDNSGRQNGLLPCRRFPQGNRAVQIFVCLSLPYTRDGHMARVYARNYPLWRERRMAYSRPCRRRSKTGNSRQNGTTKTGKSRNMWPSTSASSCKH